MTDVKKKSRLEVEASYPQGPKDGGGATKEEEEPMSLSPPAVQESATPGSRNPETGPTARSNLDSALVRLTRNFANLIKSSALGLVDLNYACKILKVPKRRLYDVVNVLEGAHLVTKNIKNSIQWLGPVSDQDGSKELVHLQQKEMKLDRLIQKCTQQIYQLFEDRHEQKFAYLTHEDLGGIPSYKEQTVMVIKAPAGAQLCVPHPDEKLCIHVVSRDGPIEVFLCPEHPDSDHQKAHTHGNHAPFQAASPSLQRDAKDPGLVGSPQARDPRQSPAATSPSSQPLAQDQQDQIFVSLASNLTCSLGGKEEMPSAMEDQGISDLFHMEQAPLELPF